MKSITTIVFTIFYLTLSTGMSVNVHLCIGKMASSEKTDCSKNGCCSNGEEQSCCTEVTYVLQLDDAEIICVVNDNLHDYDPSTYQDLIIHSSPLTAEKAILEQAETSGPIHPTPLYSLYCSHLHYG